MSKVNKTEKTKKIAPIRPKNKEEQRKKKKDSKNKKHNQEDTIDIPKQFRDKKFNYSSLKEELEDISKNLETENLTTSILNFIKLIYKNYQEQHPNKSLEDFYKMTKKAIAISFEESRKILSPLSINLDNFIIISYYETIKKLDNWIENLDSTQQIKNQNNNIKKLTHEKEKIKEFIIELLEDKILDLKKNIHCTL